MKKCKEKLFKQQKGVTLVALIITIIVLLILAGVIFNAVLGDNGLLKRASSVGTITKIEEVKEKVGLMLEEYIIETYEEEKTSTDPLYDFFNDKLSNGEIDYIVSNSTTEIIIEVDGYEFIIDKEKIEIKEEPQQVGGERPVFNIIVSNIDVEGTEKALTIDITNIASYGSNYSIEVKHTDGTISEEISLVGNGQKSYKIIKDGSYIVTVKGTKDGIEKSTSKTQEIDVARAMTTTQFSRANGVIDIIWLDKYNNKIDTPEAPVLRRINSSKMDRNNGEYNNSRRYRLV